MGAFFSNLIAKYLGQTFLKRAASTVVVYLSDIIGRYLPEINPDLLTRWSADTIEIVSITFGFLLGLLIDVKMSKKPDQPKIVK
jgi:hypothetical protein